MELVTKITAPNPGIFTGGGTNTYLIGREDVTLVDPGPNISEHIDEIIMQADGKIKRILVTHTHTDHSPAALPLSKILDVPMYGRLVDGESSWEDESFIPDIVLNDKDVLETEEYTLEVIHTPGHASNHLCYLIQEEEVMLTGDHIMNGSTVVIAHPDGSMNDYLNSLALLRNYRFNKIGPGHGDFLGDPMAVVDWIIDHRLAREGKVISKLKLFAAVTSQILVESVYDDVDPKLHPIAIWSLEAHLFKLVGDEMVDYDSANKTWSCR